MPQVQYMLNDDSHMQPVLAVVDAPDTLGPAKNDRTIRPSWVRLGVWAKDGVWEVSSAQVIGPSIRSGGAQTKHDYEVLFSHPLDSDSKAPEWLREIVAEWLRKINGEQITPVNMYKVGKERFGVSERDGAVWAIEYIRAAERAAEVAFGECGQRDYSLISAMLGAAANELVRELNGVRLPNV